MSLAGLSVAAVIRTEHTLGNVSEPVNPARAVLIVDSRAGAAERAALESFARYMGGDLLRNVVKVYYSPIELTIENGNIHGGKARLFASSLASVETRALTEGDRHCGNGMIYNPPLSEKLDHSMPAYAEANSSCGGLGETWNAPYRRSGFLGTFSVAGE